KNTGGYECRNRPVRRKGKPSLLSGLSAALGPVSLSPCCSGVWKRSSLWSGYQIRSPPTQGAIAVTAVTLILSMTPLFDVAMVTTRRPFGIFTHRQITRRCKFFCEVPHFYVKNFAPKKGADMITVPELASEALGSYLATHLGRRFHSTEAHLTE